MTYQAFAQLHQHHAELHDSLELDSGVQLAAWTNRNDRITQQADHHTLSLYVADGYQCYHKGRVGWHNGGAPDRFCFMPKESESVWDVRGAVSFVHLYCTDDHLMTLAEQTFDRSPASLRLDKRVFANDPQITSLYRQFLLGHAWQEKSNRLLLSSAANLLLNHLLSRYCEFDWRLPAVRGGLAPNVARRVCEYIEQHLDQPLPLSVLATEAGLSEYHFARMFKQSLGQSPHQYLQARRLARADTLLTASALSITEIALACGFSSTSHFSNCYRTARGQTPSALRRNR